MNMVELHTIYFSAIHVYKNMVELYIHNTQYTALNMVYNIICRFAYIIHVLQCYTCI